MRSDRSEIATQDHVAAFHEEKRYSKEYARYYHDWWTRKLLSFASPEGRILDNGCGTGILFEALPDRRYNIVGLDISARMLSYARQRAKNLVLGDSQELPFRNESYDLVVGRSLLHHLPDPYMGVKEMARVLKKGGKMVVVDTNASFLSALPRYFARRSEHFSDEHRNMQARHLVKMIGDFFHIDIVYYFGYLAYPIGFPDIIDIGGHIPRPVAITKILTKLDSLISSVPLVRTQSWGIMIKGKKMSG
jgi:ubiquinone/menaquinone biosynthesis C-methylase UbiE